ncbi:MAG: hypothetical protein IJL27_10440, partial [Firmicutes bacterium]|nr:hypothetical protein [Bacillota bacterium]
MTDRRDISSVFRGAFAGFRTKLTSFLERNSPPGSRYMAMFWNLLLMMLIGVVFAGFGSFLLRFSSEKNALYEIRWVPQQVKFLMPGAVMPGPSVLDHGIYSGFIYFAAYCLGVTATNYRSFFRESRSIYLMKRLPRAELARRCALVPAAALLCGSAVAVRVKRTVPTTEHRWEQEKKEAAYAAAADGRAELPAYVYQGDDPYLAAVCNWITSGEGGKYRQAEVTIPCPLIAEIDDSDPQDIRVWGNFWVYSYKAVGTTLISVSGGECPGLLHLRAAENGYEVFDA